MIEGLENRVHSGPPIGDAEIQAARVVLQEHEFSPSSDYYLRLVGIQSRLRTRVQAPRAAPAKRNYGGEAGGRFMQLQMVYDHLILSTCYDGEFRTQRGRIKLSHRFNQEGRIEFLELKFLTSLHSCLDGQIRKLLLVKDYQTVRRDWLTAEAFVLPALPRELVFLHEDVFRVPKAELFTWLVNLGHGIVEEMLADLRTTFAGAAQRDGWREAVSASADSAGRWSPERGYGTASVDVAAPLSRPAADPGGRRLQQLPLTALLHDPAALAMLETTAGHEVKVEDRDEKTVLARCVRKNCLSA